MVSKRASVWMVLLGLTVSACTPTNDEAVPTEVETVVVETVEEPSSDPAEAAIGGDKPAAPEAPAAEQTVGGLGSAVKLPGADEAPAPAAPTEEQVAAEEVVEETVVVEAADDLASRRAIPYSERRQYFLDNGEEVFLPGMRGKPSREVPDGVVANEPAAPGDEQAPAAPTAVTAGSLQELAEAMVAAAGGGVGVGLYDGSTLASAGLGQAYPAWSTSKVPLSSAALAQDNSAATQNLVAAALQQSDNAAADALWNQLGGGSAAASAMMNVLAAGGDGATTVPSTQLAPGFSIFGQTAWTAANQARFAFGIQCIPAAGTIASNMRNVAAGQRYGLGTIPGAAFKGGWGPDPQGLYTVRQLGFITLEGGGTLGVSIVARPGDGSYGSGQVMLSNAAAVLNKAITDGTITTAGHC